MKKVSLLAVILSFVMILTSCGSSSDSTSATPAPSTPDPELVKNTIEATIVLEDGDEIELELYPDLAPETVENFVELAEDGFYDGTIFHRVIEDFMIQGGGYDENLKEQKASTIKGEFAANGFENTLSHTRGVISMARAQQFDSASSQFFIVQEDATYLDGQYAAFGIVTEGMDVVDDIASTRTGSVTSSGMDDVPVNPIVIETITIGSGSSSKHSSSSKNIKTDKDDDDEDIDDEDLTDEDVINSLFGSDSNSSSSSSSKNSNSSSNSSSSKNSNSSSSSSSSKNSNSSSSSSSSKNSNSSSSSSSSDSGSFGLSGSSSSGSSSNSSGTSINGL
jgi:peptidyl-prolyl cis-trans isomerase B (cyclophilin B)